MLWILNVWETIKTIFKNPFYLYKFLYIGHTVFVFKICLPQKRDTNFA